MNELLTLAVVVAAAALVIAVSEDWFPKAWERFQEWRADRAFRYRATQKGRS